MNDNNKETNEFIITCPHCKEYIMIEKINCGIFRHAIFKENGNQVDPHLPKSNCEILLKENLVIGCCKPFQIIKKNIVNIESYEKEDDEIIFENNIYKIIICNYI